MSLVPRESWPDLFSVFDHDFPSLRSRFNLGAFSPRLDILEKDDKFEVQVELPGVNKEDITLSCKDKTLTIEASTARSDETKEGDRVIHKERYEGKMIRSFTLGDNIRQEDIDASFSDGILKVTIPKTEPRQEEVNRIEIK
ncbi:Hsp20/alpha crystallin family protein [Vibrio sp. HA2012]|uniref:Hsp20/alpha crystallin family protein n=1 Tax=Vibrio sp. HA2012 TaxID=1971595 RepID=UPI000C2BBA78|nr:Hsp20/alpha crystallin family protein [Vibrio sp. HA2012]PJC86876.1 Hsp20/alpha crystallin family protein [Vibrio sp. HA2012]